MSQLERAQPRIGIPRNVPARLPQSPAPVALQPRGIVPAPAVVSEGQRMAASFMQALGLSANLVGTLGQLAENRRARSEAEDREFDHLQTGQAAQARRELWADWGPQIASDDPAFEPNGRTPKEIAEDMIAPHLDGASEAYSSEFKKVVPLITGTLNQRQIKRQGEARQELGRLTIEAIRVNGDSASILSKLRLQQELDPDLTERDLGALIVQAMAGANRDQFNALDEALSDLTIDNESLRTAFNVERDRALDTLEADRIRAERQQVQDAVNAVNDQDGTAAQLAELEKRKGDLPPRIERDERNRIFKEAKARYFDDQLGHILNSTKSADALQKEWQERSELPESDIRHLSQAAREQLIRRFGEQQEIDIKRLQVYAAANGGDANISEETHSKEINAYVREQTYVGPDGQELPVINALNQMPPGSAAELTRIVRGPTDLQRGLGVLTTEIRQMVYGQMQSGDSALRDEAFRFVGMMGNSHMKYSYDLIHNAPPEMQDMVRLAIDLHGSSLPPGAINTRIANALKEDLVVDPIKSSKSYKTFAAAIGNSDEFADQVMAVFRPRVSPKTWGIDPGLDTLDVRAKEAIYAAGYERFTAHAESGTDYATKMAEQGALEWLRAHIDLIPAGEGLNTLRAAPIMQGGFRVSEGHRWGPAIHKEIKEQIERDPTLGPEVWDRIVGFQLDTDDIGEGVSQPLLPKPPLTFGQMLGTVIVTGPAGLAARMGTHPEDTPEFVPDDPSILKPLGRYIPLVRNEITNEAEPLLTEDGRVWSWRPSSGARNENLDWQNYLDSLSTDKGRHAARAAEEQSRRRFAEQNLQRTMFQHTQAP